MSTPHLLGVLTATMLVLSWAVIARRRSASAAASGRPRLVTRPAELIIPAHIAQQWARPALAEIRRAAIHEAWMKRRAAETPLFAQLAQSMGLGLALGVAA